MSFIEYLLAQLMVL
jgi:hypothetical protein